MTTFNEGSKAYSLTDLVSFTTITSQFLFPFIVGTCYYLHCSISCRVKKSQLFIDNMFFILCASEYATAKTDRLK